VPERVFHLLRKLAFFFCKRKENFLENACCYFFFCEKLNKTYTAEDISRAEAGEGGVKGVEMAANHFNVRESRHELAVANVRRFSTQANYTDRAAAACGQS
jgi:hypothetical protein